MKMTMSLLNAYEWYMNCPPSWKDRAFEGLKSTLTGVFTGNAATERGERFEDKINMQLKRRESFVGLLSPLNSLVGMEQQKWLSPLTINVNDNDETLSFTFRGKMDYIGELKDADMEELKGLSGKRVICDLKTTGSKLSLDRYTNSWQHIIYCLAEGIDTFVYFVYRFANEVTLEPEDYVVVPIDLSSCLTQERERLERKLLELVFFLKDVNLWDEYFNVFNQGRP